ncbi:uncharacterized protein IWZ02DRAFT_257676 [Phyllosticta citriasiana]|uniref:uncharacterized protein n=1 Tax=Phyllosticta citriasiana TaxID=595635 RepID=UPI0030FDA06A
MPSWFSASQPAGQPRTVFPHLRWLLINTIMQSSSSSATTTTTTTTTTAIKRHTTPRTMSWWLPNFRLVASRMRCCCSAATRVSAYLSQLSLNVSPNQVLQVQLRRSRSSLSKSTITTSTRRRTKTHDTQHTRIRQRLNQSSKRASSAFPSSAGCVAQFAWFGLLGSVCLVCFDCLAASITIFFFFFSFFPGSD